MPTVHSVSDITNILSGIIKNEPTFQEVSVTGKVSVDNLPGVFWLSDRENKIRCFIPGGNIAMFRPLLVSGNKVAVNGKITLYASNSDYQISVKDCQEIDFNFEGNNRPLTVSEITNRLLEIIGNSSELREIKVQGKISNFVSIPAANLWNLSDIDNGVLFGNAVQKIHCFSNPNLINDVISVGDGDEVQIQGAIHIFGPSSRYQIIIRQIESTLPVTLCQCSGCTQCNGTIHCDRHREIANFRSCARCLPHPPDELYALCPECYAVSVDHEDKVKDAVYAYLDELQVNGFSPYRECQIQFGSRNGSADVVLGDGNGGFAAIAECKGAGYEGHGIEQLKSYLSATDTRFGVFANKADDSKWKFYENQGGNQFALILRGQFKDGVVKGITLRKRLKHEVKFLESNRDQFKHEIGDLESKKAMIVTEIGQESQKLDVLKQAIESDRAHNQDLSSIQKHLNGEITELENQRSELDITVNQIMRTKHNLNERTSDLTQQVEALKNYKPELHEGIRRKLDILLEEKIQRLEKPLSDLKIELQKRGIVNWFKNLFSKENE